MKKMMSESGGPPKSSRREDFSTHKASLSKKYHLSNQVLCDGGPPRRDRDESPIQFSPFSIPKDLKHLAESLLRLAELNE